MSSLYELTSDFLEAMEVLDSEEDSNNMEALETTVDALGYEIEQKAESYAKYIRNLESDIEAVKREVKRLSSKRKTLENKIQILRENLKISMELSGKTKFKTSLFHFSIQKNAPSVKLLNNKEIPEEYLIKQEPKTNLEAIKKALKEGEQLDFAQLTQSESLRIR